MKAEKTNLINSLVLIIFGLWGYLDTQSYTAFIPVGFGGILMFCNNGVKTENKIISHIAVLLTLIILIALIGMRLPKSIETGGVGLMRVIVMILTSSISMSSFIMSFIKARRSK